MCICIISIKRIFSNKIDEIQSVFFDRLKQTRDREVKRGSSLTGPHRDDFVFNINGQELRKFGSRGQHKTVLISLAIAQFNLIKDKRQETPIILIDDIYSEIDSHREAKIIETLNNMGQVFVTATHSQPHLKSETDRYFAVEDGKISSLNV